jgi:hypothetical protein
MSTPHQSLDRFQRPGLSRRAFLGSTAGAVSAGTFANPVQAQAVEAPGPAFCGYLNELSFAAGDVLTLHASTEAETFDVAIEQVGVDRKTVWTRTGVPGRKYVVPEDASAHGCRWPAALELTIPADWPSGYYEVRTTPTSWRMNEKGKPAALLIYFVVRAAPEQRAAKILLQLATNTEAAYNNFGGYSLYAYNGRDGVQGRRVSFLRPAPGFMVQRWELPFLRWAEANGYAIDLAINNDLETHPEMLERYKLVLSVGHDEYWSTPMRDVLEAYVARGGNLAFFSGNVCCWQVRREGSELICFKEYYRDDPTFRSEGPIPTLATLWSHALIARPENRLTGVGVLSGGFHLSHGQYMDGSGAFTVERPEHWALAGTKLARGATFGGPQTVVGYECDGCEFERRDGLPVPTARDGTPADFEILATAPAKWGDASGLDWYEQWPKDQQGTACLGLYTRPGGGTVFTAATTDWSHGLREPVDSAVDRITRNVLDRLST